MEGGGAAKRYNFVCPQPNLGYFHLLCKFNKFINFYFLRKGSRIPPLQVPRMCNIYCDAELGGCLHGIAECTDFSIKIILQGEKIRTNIKIKNSKVPIDT